MARSTKTILWIAAIILIVLNAYPMLQRVHVPQTTYLDPAANTQVRTKDISHLYECGFPTAGYVFELQTVRQDDGTYKTYHMEVRNTFWPWVLNLYVAWGILMVIKHLHQFYLMRKKLTDETKQLPVSKVCLTSFFLMMLGAAFIMVSWSADNNGFTRDANSQRLIALAVLFVSGVLALNGLTRYGVSGKWLARIALYVIVLVILDYIRRLVIQNKYGGWNY